MSSKPSPTENKRQSSIEKLIELAHSEANQCVQCGYCLPACPTYLSIGKETASPRGRINLVKLAAEGRIDIQQHLAEPIDLCLGCRACEVACPVGVPYGHILEAAKEVIADDLHQRQQQTQPSASKAAGSADQTGGPKAATGSRWGSMLRTLVMKRLFPYPMRLRFAGNLLWLYQKSKLDKLIRSTKLIQAISEPMAAFERVLPPLESPGRRHAWGSVIPARGMKKVRIAFFAGCIMDAMMNRTNRLTIELMTLVGCEVIIPEGQNCCGALHAHQGMKEQARELARANIVAFEQSGADYYVNNAGGCGAMLHDYAHLFDNDAQWKERAKAFSAKSVDVSQVLVNYGPLPYVHPWNGIVTYQDSCHLRNVQGVRSQPRSLLQSIPGITFVEMEGCDQCCASGGIYNLLHFEGSMKILDDKMNKVNATKAATVVTTNPGCLLQMRLGVERKGEVPKMDAVHLIDVLAEACGLR